MSLRIEWALLVGLVAGSMTGCNPDDSARVPPLDRFYYPTGLAFDRSGGGEGVLYVASGNSDKRYRAGTLLAVNLDAIGVPALGTPLPLSGPVAIEGLGVTEDSVLEIANFTSEIRTYDVNGTVRLFMASRAEENRLQVVDTDGARLTCQRDPTTRQCGDASFDLTSLASTTDGRPQARAPVGVGISAKGMVVVTHQTSAKLAEKTEVGDFYVVKTSAQTPDITPDSFLPIKPCWNGDCEGGSQGVAVGERYAYVTGRIGRGSGTQFLPGNLLRWVDLSSSRQAPRVATVMLESEVQQFEGRGIALRPDESRLYMVTRGVDSLVTSGPSMLFVIDVTGATTDSPSFKLVQTALLPERCDEVRLIQRGTASDLVVVGCSDAGAVVIYDAGLRRIVANIRAGAQTFALAVDQRGTAVRIFAGAFTDGQVQVIDMPDYLHPENARVVARLGKQQACLVRTQDPACATGGTP